MQAWVTDITNIRVRNSWLYLTAELDLFSRKIVSWTMALNMPTVLGVFRLADDHYPTTTIPRLIIHSDQDSMSDISNCWDNAVMMRFFLSLKMERVWRRNYANHQKAICDLTETISLASITVSTDRGLFKKPPEN